MLEAGRFIDLPEEFAPPERAAERIAAMNTIAEREAFWCRVPKGWQPMIATLATHAIAVRISEMATKFERQNALASVPEMWRAEVRALVLSFFATREIRARYRAEQAERAAATARRKERAAA